MAKYRCSVCGYIYDEEKENGAFSDMSECPVCHQPSDRFTVFEEEPGSEAPEEKELKLDFPKEFLRRDKFCRYMEEMS